MNLGRNAECLSRKNIASMNQGQTPTVVNGLVSVVRLSVQLV
jgi:hypothetical protein